MTRVLSGLIALWPTVLAAFTPIAPEAVSWLDHECRPGAQAAGMGGAVTALAEDWTAAWHNPALLAWRRRLEFNLGFDAGGVRQSLSVSTDGASQTRDKSSSGLSHAGYVHPLPALRGGVCWGMGWLATADHAAAGAFPDRVWRVSERQAGGRDAWLLSLAAQWTPHLAAGASMVFHDGNLEQVDREENLEAGTYWQAFDRVTLEGVGFRLGLACRGGPWRAGLLLEPAHSLDIDWRHVERTGELAAPTRPHETWWTSGYGLRVPLLVSAGAGWKTRFMQAGLAWDWQDWSALAYEDLPAGQDLVLSDELLSRALRARHRLRAGGEWTLPATDLRLRAGAWVEGPGRRGGRLVAWDEENQPYEYWDFQEERPRAGLSLGAGWLAQEAVALDLAVTLESWERRWLEYGGEEIWSVIRQDLSRWRAQLAIVYRI